RVLRQFEPEYLARWLLPMSDSPDDVIASKRADRLADVAAELVNIPLVALLFFQPFDVFIRRLFRMAALLPRDAAECLVHILGHAAGVSTYIQVGAIVQPSPELWSMLQHQVLHVQLALLVPRERCIQPRQVSVVPHCLHLFAVKVVRRRVPIAEEEPVAPFRALCSALMEKSAEGSNAGARPNHDDRSGSVRG